MSGTVRKRSAAAAKVATASTTNIARQDITASAATSGAVASSEPAPPATIIQPDKDACRSDGYHMAMALRGAMRHTAEPRPISARASARPDRLSLAAKASAPHPAKISSTGSTRLGPYRSSIMPAGNCVSAKARKYALVSRPSDDALIPSSAERSGEMTALTVRYTYDSRYAKAKPAYRRRK